MVPAEAVSIEMGMLSIFEVQTVSYTAYFAAFVI